MPAKKKINNESKTTEINVKNDMKRCKQIEEKLTECIDISDDVETKTNESNETVETKQSISTKSDTKNKYDNIIYSPDAYVLKFGKYEGMKANDVKELEVVKMNKKSG